MMKELEEKVFSQKAIINTNLKRQKLDDLDFLAKQTFLGPFTFSGNVRKFMETEPESKEKNHRMYREVHTIDENLNCNSSTQVSSPNDQTFQYGEHLACVWHDKTENCLKWYVGVVDVVDGEDKYVSYMERSEKQGLRWLFPDETDIHKTSPERVLLCTNFLLLDGND